MCGQAMPKVVAGWGVRHPKGQPNRDTAGRMGTAVVRVFAQRKGLVEPLKLQAKLVGHGLATTWWASTREEVPRLMLIMISCTTVKGVWGKVSCCCPGGSLGGCVMVEWGGRGAQGGTGRGGGAVNHPKVAGGARQRLPKD